MKRVTTAFNFLLIIKLLSKKNKYEIPIKEIQSNNELIAFVFKLSK